MKKRVFLSLLTALLLVLVLSVVASAQGPTSYTSGFQVQNLSDTDDANVVITYYTQSGTSDATVNDTIAAGTSATYFPIDASAGFNGSVVISSDQPVAAIVNILGDGGAFGGASYDSFSTGSANANIPLVLNDFFGINTFFNVQNTGSAPTTVSVSYTTSGGSCSATNATIQPGAAATFDQTSDCTASQEIGAATVSSDGEIAVAVVQYDSQSLLAYNAFTSAGSSTAIAPLVSQNFFGSRTALQVQNTGGSSADVTVNFSPSPGFPGAACSQTITGVAAGASANFGDSAFFNNTPACNAGSGWVGGAEVDAGSGTIVAIVNTVTTGTANAAAYSAFDPSNATTVVSFPLIMQDNFGIFTGFGLSSADGSSINISCTFANSAETTGATGVTGFTSVQDGNNDVDLGSGYVGAATCTGTGPIVGVVSQLGGNGDKLLYYEGFNN